MEEDEEQRGAYCSLCQQRVEEVSWSGWYYWRFRETGYKISSLLLHYYECHEYLPESDFLEEINQHVPLWEEKTSGFEEVGNVADFYRYNVFPAKIRRQYPLFDERFRRLMEQSEKVRLGERLLEKGEAL